MWAISFEKTFLPNGDTLPQLNGESPFVSFVSPGFFATMGMRVLLGRDFRARRPRGRRAGGRRQFEFRQDRVAGRIGARQVPHTARAERRRAAGWSASSRTRIPSTRSSSRPCSSTCRWRRKGTKARPACRERWRSAPELDGRKQWRHRSISCCTGCRAAPCSRGSRHSRTSSRRSCVRGVWVRRCSRARDCWRCSSPLSASTAPSPTPSASARRKSASASRSAPRDRASSHWCSRAAWRLRASVSRSALSLRSGPAVSRDPCSTIPSPYNPIVLGGVALVLLTVAVIASVVPALRAKSVDPMEALRAE